MGAEAIGEFVVDIALCGNDKSSVFLPASVAEKINLNLKRHRLVAVVGKVDDLLVKAGGTSF